jgi:bacterioferritin (cytochrome b1)
VRSGLTAEDLGGRGRAIDFLDRQFDLIKQIGIERYVMLNAAPAAEQGA